MTAAADRRSTHDPAWPAMVLTAGLGTRLRPLSLLCAKPALPVAGVPLVGRILRWLSASDVRSTVLNLHHLPATITAAVGDGTGFGVQVRYSWERTILGSAGGPARALPLVGADQFFVVNGDTLTDVNLAALATDHQQSGAQVTLALVPNPDPLHYGGVTVDGDGRVTGFTPPGPANMGLHFIGVQAVDADVFAPLDPDVPAETINGIYRRMMARRPGCVRAFVSGAAFRDIGTAADYLDTCLDIARIEHVGECLLGRGVTVADGARVTNCVLWDDVRVGHGVTLDRSVVAAGVSIPDGARHERSIIRPRDGPPAEPGEHVVGDLLVSSIDARRPAASEEG
ncbi:MAG: NDP-sugar synthase [Acidobacteria bacterium]|nr:NDP-sugar synthase [Acidobacteriota bacterium]